MSDSTTSVANQSTVETVPSAWPGAFGIYKHSKAAVMVNISTIIIGILVAIAASVLYDTLDSALKIPYIFDTVFQLLFSAYVMVVEAIILLKCLDGKKVTLGEAAKSGVDYLAQGLLLLILLAVAATVSLLLFIVPFFIVMPRLILAPFYLVRKNMSATDALRASWDTTKGNVGKVYGLVGVNILIVLLAFTIIGIPFAIYFSVLYSAAFTVLYAFLVESKSGQKATT